MDPDAENRYIVLFFAICCDYFAIGFHRFSQLNEFPISNTCMILSSKVFGNVVYEACAYY